MPKLYYTGKKTEYADQGLDDPFLKALADGGFQVGELAKYMFCYDPVADNITINNLGYNDALLETENRLKQPGKIVISEATFRFRNLFIRTDIIVKEGNRIDLYEVKAKSYKESEITEDIFISYKGKPNEGVSSVWQLYLYDLAFQKYVLAKAHPEYQICAHLLLVDKFTNTTIDGLNQKFRVVRATMSISGLGVEGFLINLFSSAIN